MTTVAGAGIAYWQRRRLRRLPASDDLRDARDVAVPSVEEPVSVSTSHLETSRERARSHLEETEAVLGDDPPSSVRDTLEWAREELEAYPVGTVSDDATALEALEAYRHAIAGSASARSAQYGDSDEPSDDLRAAHERLGEELEATTVRYRGDSLASTIVQCARAESLVRDAASAHDRAAGYIGDEDFATSVIWESVEIARARLRDAELFLQGREGTDMSSAVEAAYERLDSQSEAAVESLGFRSETDTTYAYERWARRVPTGRSPEGALEDGSLALAARRQASRAMLTFGLDALTDLPAVRRTDSDDLRLVEDSERLRRAKQDAVDAITGAFEAFDPDPIVRHLLLEAIERVDRGDRRLEWLLSGVRSYDADDWQYGLDRAYLRYREAEADARAVRDVVPYFEDTAGR